jgi:hypothetical protein
MAYCGTSSRQIQHKPQTQRAERLPTTRLSEARGYVEHALTIKEQLDASAAIWAALGILARIADLAGQAEVARRYARRERESFAGFAGNRYFIDERFGHLIAAVAAAAEGDLYAREQVQTVLPKLEVRGWRLAEASQRIWAGDRDWHSLLRFGQIPAFSHPKGVRKTSIYHHVNF